jgi:hypothetical protein
MKCLLKQVVERKTEGARRRERRGKHLPYDLKVRKIYWDLKEEALDHTVYRTRFGSGHGSVAR